VRQRLACHRAGRLQVFIVSAEPGRRVVVATDFSDGSERALTVGVGYAKLLGAKVDLVHIYPLLASSGVLSPIPGVVPTPAPPPDVLDEIERRLDALGTKVQAAGVDRLITIRDGKPADEIVAHARHVSAELIVVGTHGRTGIRKALLGSVAEQVLQHAHCPVLVVPPPRD
jgi:nucleotide-binding universal stress UspA family protein